MTSSSLWNHSSARLLTLVFLGVGIVGGGCGSASKAKGDDGGGGGSAGSSNDAGADVPQGTAGAGGTVGGTGQAGSGGPPGAGGSGGGGKGDAGVPDGGSTSLPACLGVDPTLAAQACRTSADCSGLGFGSSCGPTYHVAGCGVCLPAPHDCSGDGGCSPEKVCVPAMGPCQCNLAGGPGMVCALRCTATSCESGQTCDTASGLCKPTPCGQDFSCAAGFLCAPTRAGADAHGCAIASCATDGYKCPAGSACTPAADANANGCSPVSCVGGSFLCPANTDCKAASTSPHHCERRGCTSDKTCDCGACIESFCQDRLYVCSPPPAA
jgi:hypothetical protein